MHVQARGDDRERVAGADRLAERARDQEGRRRPGRALPRLHRAVALPPPGDGECEGAVRRLAEGRRARVRPRPRRPPPRDPRPARQQAPGRHAEPAPEPARRHDLPHPGPRGDAPGERARFDHSRRGDPRVADRPRQAPVGRHRPRGGGVLLPLPEGLPTLRALEPRAVARPRCAPVDGARPVRADPPRGQDRGGVRARERGRTQEDPLLIRIGVDVGGTFTDLAAVDGEGRVVIAKCASTPRDPSEGLMEGLGLLASELGLDLPALLARTEAIVHGTTVATNALLEKKGARVGLLTTEGHRDVIEMREGLKDDRYNLRMPPPVPLVPRALRFEVRERMRHDGRVEEKLDPRSLAAGIAELAKAPVDAIAVCYLHAYRDARHERLTRKEIERRLPGAYVSLSSDVLPQVKEYERFGTTVVNAYVGPALSRYLGRLAERLEVA